MERAKLNYNPLAGNYHSRYSGNRLTGIEASLLALAAELRPDRTLEVGCGTGHWVQFLREAGYSVMGADSSTGMLTQAAGRIGTQNLVVADANHLPFAGEPFDLIFSVNAIHHFDDAGAFLHGSFRLLRTGGVAAIVGIDPRATRRRYFYDYFAGALELDLARYSSFGSLLDHMIAAGFERVELRIVDRYDICFTGKAVFEDPFLEKSSNSLLALLSDAVYNEGLARIRSAIELDPSTEFRSDISFVMLTGVKG